MINTNSVKTANVTIKIDNHSNFVGLMVGLNILVETRCLTKEQFDEIFDVEKMDIGTFVKNNSILCTTREAYAHYHTTKKSEKQSTLTHASLNLWGVEYWINVMSSREIYLKLRKVLRQYNIILNNPDDYDPSNPYRIYKRKSIAHVSYEYDITLVHDNE